MTMVSPEEMLKRSQEIMEKMKEAKSKTVVVGILADDATTKVYDTGVNVLEVGTWHEFGRGNNPKRSFLNHTFDVKRKAIKQRNFETFEKVLNTPGMSVEQGLNTMGAYFTNFVKEAFTNNGFGSWKALEAETVLKKGSSRVLFDKGILRRSITWQVRG